jgi:predicted O-linked N-acetylglucosamine transferase (SPINDLY family)
MNPQVEIMLQQAIQSFQNNNFERSDSILTGILKRDAKCLPALHILGLIRASQGKFNEAVEFFQKALKLNPQDKSIRLNLAKAFSDQGMDKEALPHFKMSTEVMPGNANAWIGLGKTLANLNKEHDAVDCYDKALSIDNRLVGGWSNKAFALFKLEKYQDSLNCYDEVIALEPNNPIAWSEKGAVLHALQRYEEAIFNYDKAITINPSLAAAFLNKGAALKELKRNQEALSLCKTALNLDPNMPEAWLNAGINFRELKQFDNATYHLDQALKLNPKLANNWSSKGLVLHELKRRQEALHHFDRAIELNPNYAEAWNNRGLTLNELRRYEEALNSFDRAIELNPNYAEAWSNKGGIYREFSNYISAIECFKKAYALKPDIDWAIGDCLYATLSICLWEDITKLHNNIACLLKNNHKTIIPFALLALVDDPLLHKKASEIFTRSKCPANLALGPVTTYPKHQKIRIGYFSANFYNHAVGFLMAELFELHDKNQFELIGFSFGRMPKDETQKRIAAQFNHFYEVENMADTEIVQLSRSLNIDIAVDLMGFTQDARTGIFTQRAAPIQVNYLGYPGTMGADYIDYIIADTTLIPPELQQYYSEKIVYLPNCYQVNDRKRPIADKQFTRQELGLPEAGFVFACFNNNFKILPATFNVWIKIVNAVEGSVLWLLADNPSAKQNLLQEAQAGGLDPKRLIFADRMPLPEHLARHRQANLFLDTWPYNAHTTASDALWAGLPILTLIGASFASRVAASLLNAIGLPELITKTQEEYESMAIKLALNPQQLMHIKEKLNANRLTAPLFDTPLFTKHLELAFTKMHEQHHAQLAPDNLWIQ